LAYIFVAEVWSNFNDSDVIGPKAAEFGQIRPFKVIQGQQFRYQLQVPMCVWCKKTFTFLFCHMFTFL